MEPEKRTLVDSVESAQNGKRARPDANVNDDVKVHLKMLLVPAECGRVIGKGGDILKKIATESGASVRLSANDEVLPTGERVAMIGGNISQITFAQNMISDILSNSDTNDEQTPARTLKFLVPNSTTGKIIGKGGSLIKEMMANSGANIQISQVSEVIMATQERVVTISASTSEGKNKAQIALYERMLELPIENQPQDINYSVLKTVPQGGAPQGYGNPQQYSQYPQQPYSNPSSYMTHSPQLPPAMSAYGQGQSQYTPLPTMEKPISLPERLVSGLIGRGGSIIKDINLRSGAKVRLTQKDQLNERGERTVIFEGQPDKIVIARKMILDRIHELEEENAGMRSNLTGGGGGGSVAALQSMYPPETAKMIAQQQAQQYSMAAQAQQYGYGSAPSGLQPDQAAAYDMYNWQQQQAVAQQPQASYPQASYAQQQPQQTQQQPSYAQQQQVPHQQAPAPASQPTYPPTNAPTTPHYY